MNMVPVNSSMIAAVGYDPDTRELRIRFTNGAQYAYDNVDEADAEGLQSAGSAGSFFHAHIKGSYDGYPV